MEVQKTRSDHDESGLWTGDLLRQLLWIPDGSPVKRSEPLSSISSWSWGSTMGPVHMMNAWETCSFMHTNVAIEDSGKRLVIRSLFKEGRVSGGDTLVRSLFPASPVISFFNRNVELRFSKYYDSVYLIRSEGHATVGWAIFGEDQNDAHEIVEAIYCIFLMESNDFSESADEHERTTDQEDKHQDGGSEKRRFLTLLVKKAVREDARRSSPSCHMETYVRVGVGLIREKYWVNKRKRRLYGCTDRQHYHCFAV